MRAERLAIALHDEDREGSTRHAYPVLGADQSERRPVDLLDDTLTVEEQVPERRQLEEIGVEVARHLQGVLRLDELRLLRLELFLVHLEIVHERAALGVVVQPRFQAVQVGDELGPRHLLGSRIHGRFASASDCRIESPMKAARSPSAITRLAFTTKSRLSGAPPRSSTKSRTCPVFGSSSSSRRRNEVAPQRPGP